MFAPNDREPKLTEAEKKAVDEADDALSEYKKSQRRVGNILKTEVRIIDGYLNKGKA